jgi:hypothetical protein
MVKAGGAIRVRHHPIWINSAIGYRSAMAQTTSQPRVDGLPVVAVVGRILGPMARRSVASVLGAFERAIVLAGGSR